MAYDATKDLLSSTTASALTPAKRVVAVVPSNTVDLDIYAKAIRIDGVPGSIKFVPVGNLDTEPVTWNVATGEVLAVQVRRVFATGTTATGIFALIG